MSVASCSSQALLPPDGDLGDTDAGSGGDGGNGSDGGDPLVDAGVGIPDAPVNQGLAQMCGGTAPTTAADWERCYVKRYCETHVHCGELNQYASVQECIDLSDAVSGGALGFEVAERVRAVADGRATIDVNMFTSCLEELAPQRCSTAGTAAACALRYKGTVPSGQSCHADAECAAPGAQCEPRDCGLACCTGTCTAKKKLGETCADLRACEPGLVCSVTSQKCVTGDIGSTCDRYDCDAANWCSAGKCAADRAVGAQCASLLECGGETVCVGLKRPSGPARCQRATVAGDPCDWFCLGNLYCDLPSTGQGVCRPLPGIGQPCSDAAPCKGATLRCNNGACAARPTAGQACTDGACAPGLFCTDQLGAANPTCRAPFSDGETGCKRDSQCASYLCTGDQTTAGQCVQRQSTCP